MIIHKLEMYNFRQYERYDSGMFLWRKDWYQSE